VKSKRRPNYPWLETDENVFDWILRSAQDIRDGNKVDRILSKIQKKPYVPATKIPPRD